MIKKNGYLIVFFVLSIFIQFNTLFAQSNDTILPMDSVYVSSDSMIIFRNGFVVPISDSLILIAQGVPYKIKYNRYKKSQAFYDSVYFKTHKRRVTKELYNYVVSHRPEDKNALSGEHIIAQNPFEAYQGKIIKNIRFVKVDILDGSVDDTLREANSTFSKLLNKSHISTHQWILKKFLLVKPGEEIIPAILADNERVFREIPAIEDARIVVVSDSVNDNYADLIVITKDIFSIGATATASSFDKFNASIWDDNSFGLAYELGVKLMYDSYFKNPFGYEIYSKYRNFLSTFIDGTIRWYDAYNSRQLTFSISKGFINPQTKYAGGISIGWVSDKFELSNQDTLLQGNYKTNFQDFWLGRSILIGDKSSRNNLYLSTRFERKEFTRRPLISADSNLSFHNRNIYYAKIGYSQFKFYKATMIRSFGIPEDIPYGINTGFTVAYLNGDHLKRTYFGLSFGAGKYFEKAGYLAGNIVAGGFYNNAHLSQGLFECNALYYTPLLKFYRYSSRTFLRFRYREAITKDIETSINFEESIRNLNPEGLGGTSTMVFNFESVIFSPWYFYGFRFAPYAFADVGMISNTNLAFTNTDVYTAIGLGFRIRNESLSFKNIILSFGYIPNAPGGNIDYFYSFSMGDDPLVEILGVSSPYILSRSLILPY